MRIGYNLLSRPGNSLAAAIECICSAAQGSEHFVFRYNKDRRKSIEAARCPQGPGLPAHYSLRSWLYEEIFLPFSIAEKELDVFFSPALNLPYRQPCRSAVALNGISSLFFQDEQEKGMEAGIKRKVRLSAAKKANRVIVPSFFARSALIARFGFSEARLKVVPPSIERSFIPVFNEEKINSAKQKHGIASSYFIYSGSSGKRNGLKQLIEIFYGSQPSREKSVLVIDSPVPEQQKKDLSKLDSRGKVVFTDIRDDGERCLLINGAAAFVTASSFEPDPANALRALSCGIPVIAFDNSAFPEMVGHSGILIKDGDRAEFARAMKETRDNPNVRLQLRALGIQHAKKFSVEKAAKALMDLFEEIRCEKYLPDAK